MARYYSYGRRRYGRRYYRRGYRRYGGTSLRRYRSVQMNDNETKVMTFTNVCRVTLVPGQLSPVTGTALANVVYLDPINLTGPEYTVTPGTPTQQVPDPPPVITVRSSNVTSIAGRIFFAGYMFDRLRFRSVSCTIRPSVMPSGATAGNYSLYAAWDRYGSPQFDGATRYQSYNIFTDPSAKQVMWTPGGSGSALRAWIYSTFKDRYQYHSIVHNSSNTSANNDPTWTLTSSSSSASAQAPQQPFFPVLLLSLNVPAASTNTTSVTLYVTTRFTIEFQGGYSSTSLSFTGTRSAGSGTSLLEERISTLERMYNSNPADNNDDLTSVLNELSAPQ